MLAPRKQLQAAADARKARHAAAKAGQPLPQDQPLNHTRGPGEAAAARWRVSFVARQAIENYFDPDSEPRGALATDTDTRE